MKRDLIDITDLSVAEIDDLIAVAEDIIDRPEAYREKCRYRKLATLFYEPSTRTRLSFEAAMYELGGQVLGIASIFTYGMKKSVDRLAQANVKNVSLTDLDTVARAAADEGYIRPEDRARLIAFRDDPSDESWIGAQ